MGPRVMPPAAWETAFPCWTRTALIAALAASAETPIDEGSIKEDDSATHAWVVRKYRLKVRFLFH